MRESNTVRAKILVTGCATCPMREEIWSGMEALCRHPLFPDAERIRPHERGDLEPCVGGLDKEGMPAPAFCPLRKAPLQVVYHGK